MATHKVIQDIEAEDKFLGPLTLKQFIFGAAAIFFGYLSFFSVVKGAAVLLIVFVPPALLGAFLAIPWSSEQATEDWVVAKLRFMFKPKVRVWDQAGLEELVTITAPKKLDKQLTKGFDQNEVQSRLKALADTIDSRGWAVKNASLNDVYTLPQQGDSERLLNIDNLPQEVPAIDVNQYPDVLDEDTTVSENFDEMIEVSSQKRRQQSLEKMERIRNGESLESIQQPEIKITPAASIPEPQAPSAVKPFAPPATAQLSSAPVSSRASTGPSEDEILEQLRNKRQAGDLANSHLRHLSSSPAPKSHAQGSTTDNSQAQAQMTNTPDPAIMSLAQNNDLNIETIARQAKRNDAEDNEVVISLR